MDDLLSLVCQHGKAPALLVTGKDLLRRQASPLPGRRWGRVGGSEDQAATAGGSVQDLRGATVGYGKKTVNILYFKWPPQQLHIIDLTLVTSCY